MNKILRYSLVSLLTLFCGSIYAEEVTIDFDNDYETLFPGMGTSSGSNESYVPDGEFTSNFTTTAQNGITFTVEASPEDAGTKNRLWATAPRLRMYNGTLTINSTTAFSKIVFTLSTNKSRIADENTVNVGELSKTNQQQNATVTWTGDATTSLVITIAGNTQFSKAVFTLGEGGGEITPTPTFDGPTVSNISSFLNQAEDTEVQLALTNAQVTYVNDFNGQQVFVRDNTGAMVFDAKIGFSDIKTGDKISCKVIGKRGAISGFTNAMLQSENTTIENLSTSSGSVDYVDLSIDEAADYICDAVVLKGVTVENNNAVLGSDQIALYDRFKLNLLSSLKQNGSTYNIYGLIYDGGQTYGMELVLTKVELVSEVSTEVKHVTVSEALEITNALEDGKTTSDEYIVKGFIVGNPDFQRKDGVLYGNVNLEIADQKGGSSVLTIYRGKSFNNDNFTEETISILKDGDEVEFQGKLKKFVKDGETTLELVDCYLLSVNGHTSGVNNLTMSKNSNAPVYNMAGQRVEKALKGVYIQNGKKFIVK